MCGIYGIYYADRGRMVEVERLRAMGDAIHHRGPDESGTLAQLRRLRSEIFEPKIARFEGRFVGSAGDTVLRLTPPLTITGGELDAGLARLEEVLT